MYFKFLARRMKYFPWRDFFAGPALLKTVRPRNRNELYEVLLTPQISRKRNNAILTDNTIFNIKLDVTGDLFSLFIAFYYGFNFPFSSYIDFSSRDLFSGAVLGAPLNERFATGPASKMHFHCRKSSPGRGSGELVASPVTYPAVPHPGARPISESLNLRDTTRFNPSIFLPGSRKNLYASVFGSRVASFFSPFFLSEFRSSAPARSQHVVNLVLLDFFPTW